MELAYPRQYVENIIIGLEDPLNQHLVKLVGFGSPVEQRGHFPVQGTGLAKIQSPRMRGRTRPLYV
jgi:hypothetical protein